MTDLFAQIIADPTNLTLRLVYADELIERGDPRGELIHAQCALETAPDRAMRVALRRQIAGLLRAHGVAFGAERTRDGGLWRGFLDTAYAPDEHGEDLPSQLATRPVRLIVVEGLDAPLHDVLACPGVDRITELELYSVSDLAPLVHGPPLARLERLHVEHASPLLGAAISRSPALRTLEVSRELGIEDARMLAALPLTALRELSCVGTVIDAASLEILVDAPWFPQLERLELPNSRIDAAIAARIAAAGTALRTLDVSWTPLGVPGLERLLAAPWLPRLHALGLENVRVPIAPLAQAPFEELWQLRTGIYFDDTPALDAPAFASLRSLRLSGWIGAAAAESLAANQRLARLESLEIMATHLGSAGAVALMQAPAFGDLTALVLKHCGIGHEGARAIADAPQLAGLIELELVGNPLGSEGVGALTRSPHLAGLYVLAVGRAQCDPPTIAAVRAGWPGALILTDG